MKIRQYLTIIIGIVAISINAYSQSSEFARPYLNLGNRNEKYSPQRSYNSTTATTIANPVVVSGSQSTPNSSPDTVRVRRGDTWESIAKSYNISEDDLRQMNGNLIEPYVGMRVIIPGELIALGKRNKELAAKEAENNATQALFKTAESQVSRGKLKDAVKTYDRIIREHPSGYAYYCRGLTQYYRDKWEDAASDLSRASKSSDLPEELKKDASRLSNEANHNQAIHRQEKAQMWGEIFNFAANTAIVAYNIHEQNKAAKRNSSSQTNATSKSSGTYGGYVSSSSSSTKKYDRTEAAIAESNRLMKESEEKLKKDTEYVWNNYFRGDKFVENYLSGRPTMPSASEMGYTGINAYSYDLQRDLSYQGQLYDLNVAKQTEELVNQGMALAQQEIANFSTLYGREPTAEEIEEIYKKYTQGYIDAYAEYVDGNIETSKELGLGVIERTEYPTSNNKETPSTTTTGKTTGATTKGNGPNKTTSTTTKGSQTKDKKEDKNDVHTQYKGGNLNTDSDSYGKKIKNVSMAVKDGASYRNVSRHGELYQKNGRYYVKIGNTFFSVSNTSGPYNSYIVYGSTAHYFNR